MSLDEFLVELKKDVDSFEKTWRDGNKRNSKFYPLELGEENDGLWYEQFITYLSTITDSDRIIK